MTTTAPLPNADEARHVLEFDLYGFTVLERAITETRSAELAAVLARADRDAGTEGFPADAWGNMTARQRQLLRMEHGVGQPRASDF